MNNSYHGKGDITPLCGIINRENNLCPILQVSDNSLLMKNSTEQLARSVSRSRKELNINADTKEAVYLLYWLMKVFAAML